MLLTVLHLIFKQPFYLWMAALMCIFSVFNMVFFRDPERIIPSDPNLILSPADGKIIQIVEVRENNFFNRPVTRLSIFLSVFNVHVNRSPISGRVEYFAYHRGSFLPAFKEKASLENEQTAIGIVDAEGHKIMFTQIAGIIARRIVCELREGHHTKAGERMGMIRYGSRVDVYFLKEEVDLKVKEGDSVKGGTSIIGVFR